MYSINTVLVVGIEIVVILLHSIQKIRSSIYLYTGTIIMFYLIVTVQ